MLVVQSSLSLKREDGDARNTSKKCVSVSLEFLGGIMCAVLIKNVCNLIVLWGVKANSFPVVMSSSSSGRLICMRASCSPSHACMSNTSSRKRRIKTSSSKKSKHQEAQLRSYKTSFETSSCKLLLAHFFLSWKLLDWLLVLRSRLLKRASSSRIISSSLGMCWSHRRPVIVIWFKSDIEKDIKILNSQSTSEFKWNKVVFHFFFGGPFMDVLPVTQLSTSD